MSTAAQGFSGAYPFFHRGATTLHFLEPIAVGTDPTISPGWARPLGWRVATADGLLAWDKTGTADTDWNAIGGGVVGGITQIISSDGSITVTDPTGPITDLTLGGDAPNLFDVTLSYGHGMDVDAILPPATSFWLTATTIADLARADQVREWPVDKDLAVVGVDVSVGVLSGYGEGDLPLIVTIDGSDTALVLSIPDGTEDEVFSTSAPLPVAAGSVIGLRVDGAGVGEAVSFRAQARIHGSKAGASGGLVVVSHDATLTGDGTPSSHLSTRIKGIQALLAANGIEADFDSGSGVYTLRGSYLPPFGGGLIYEDVAGVGRRFDNGTQLVATDFINLLNLNEQQDFVWAAISNTFQTQGSPALITAAWIAIQQEILGNVTTAPEVTLFLADGTHVTSTGQITADGSKFQFPVTSDLFMIPVSPPPSCNTNIPIEDMAPGVFGGTGMYAKVTKAGVVTGGPLTAKIVVQITLNLAGTP